ncbi:hypothetical protein [Bacillus cereus]
MIRKKLQLSRVDIPFDRDHRNNENADKDKIERAFNEQNDYIQFTVESQDKRIDNLVINGTGDSNPEVIDSRTNNRGEIFDNLRNRFNALDVDLETRGVDVTWFGAVGDCEWSGSFNGIPNGTDDTIAIQRAIDYAICNGLSLVFPNKKFLVKKTLLINGKLKIYGNGADIIGYLHDKSQPIILMMGNDNGYVEKINIHGCGYIPLAGIQFKKPDNQALELYKINVSTCRHGMYTSEEECINRLVVSNCHMTSNLIGGVFFKSFDESSTFAHSAPVFFQHTILNSNGIPEWITDETSYDGIPVLNSNDKYGFQLYCRGIGGLVYRDGQISNHGHHKNLAMILLDSCNDSSIINTDVEDFGTNAGLVTKSGMHITNMEYMGEDIEGACLVYRGGRGFSFKGDTGSYNIRVPNFIKLITVNNTDVFIDVSTTNINECRYSVNTVGNNWSKDINILRINYTGDYQKLSPSAFFCVRDREAIEKVFEVVDNEMLQPINHRDWLFDKCNIDTQNRYTIDYYQDANNPNFEKGLYVVRDVSFLQTLFIKLKGVATTYTPSVQFFISFLNRQNEQIEYRLFTLQALFKIDINDTDGITMFQSIVPANAVKAKFGFINTVNRTDYFSSVGNLKGISIFGVTDVLYESFDRMNNLAHFKHSLVLGKNITYAERIPTSGEWKKGQIILFLHPESSNRIGCVCIAGGTPGIWKTFGPLDA